MVTASKHEESLERTPLAVSAVSAEGLERAEVHDIEHLSQLVPNFNIGVNGVTGGLDISIRGITTENDIWAGNPAIAVYVDGVYVARTQALNQSLYDLARVEVLRGPQGTLYGRNATGGTVNVITAKPALDAFAASADISYGNYDSVISHGMVNIPINQTLALRAAFSSEDNDGYVKTNDGSYNEAHRYAGRIAALWEPAASFSWSGSVDFSRDTGKPSLPVGTPLTGQTFIDLSSGAPLPAQSATQLNPFERSVNLAGELDLETWDIRSRIDFRMPDDFALAYVAGYGQVNQTQQNDNDGTNLNVFNLRRVDGENSQSHEIDFSYRTAQLNWLAGANYFQESENGDLGIDFFGPLIFPNAATQFPQTLQFYHPDNEQRSFGSFSQATHSLNRRLRATAGVRYSNDRHEFRGAEGIYFCGLGAALNAVSTCAPLPPAPPGPPAYTNSIPNARSGRWSNVSWKAGLDFDLTDNTLLYGTVSTGYKAGGLGEVPSTRNYDPEKVISFEVGTKTRSNDGRVTFNTSFFDMKYSDYQVTQNEVVGTQPSAIPGVPVLITELVTANAAAATIYGAEFETAWLATSQDRIDGYVSYIHATFDKFPGQHDLLSDPFAAHPLDLSGRHLVRTPAVTARVNYQHTFVLAEGAAVIPSLSYYWQASEFLREFNAPIDREPSYGLLEGRIAYSSANEHWRVEAFGQNLTNKTYRVAEFQLIFLQTSFYGTPRTYGMRLGYRY